MCLVQGPNFQIIYGLIIEILFKFHILQKSCYSSNHAPNVHMSWQLFAKSVQAVQHENLKGSSDIAKC